MGEHSERSTFVLGLRVDEDGDLRFAVSDSVIEMRLNAADEPLALRQVSLADVEEDQLAAWEHPGGPER